MSVRRILVLAAVLMLALAAPASAAQVEKIASGLDNPRHLAFGKHGLYVAEAGRGGTGPCVAGPEGSVCGGATGAVTLIDDHGQHRVAEGLASFGAQGTGESADGPHGIYVTRHGKVLITNGGPGEANRDSFVEDFPFTDLAGRVLRIKSNGDIKKLVDVWGFERDHNPDAQDPGSAIDSNPVDVLADGKRLIVADAGGNTLLKAHWKGDVEALSVFHSRNVPDPFGGMDPVPMQAVPTGVVKGPNGDYYMSQLTGFPFPVGAANVYRVDRDSGDSEVFASGFTNIMDLAFDKKGTLWVLEIDHDSLFDDTSTDGAIFSVDKNGQKTQLDLPPGTLTLPGGITVGDDGNLYVTNKATAVGAGEVLKIDVNGGGHNGDGDDDNDHQGHHGHHHHGGHDHHGHHKHHGHHGHDRDDD